MSSSLAPNKIHSLPVRVSYYLPSTSQTFSTIFTTPQQVYVHPNTAASSTKNGVEEEAWGSIYLKTVVLGVLMASPELHPSYPSTPDLSLYVLDPRETYLRRSRAGSSPYITQNRNYSSSSPSSDINSSPNRSYGISHPPPTQEVWTGKGLVSWALEEPGQGKNLITGRLIRSSEFTNTTKQQDMNPLEALMMANSAGTSNEETWGIEISVGLKSGINGPIGLQSRISSVMTMDGRPDALRRSSTSSSTETNVSTSINPHLNGSASSINHFNRPQYPLPKKQEHLQQPRRPQLPTPTSSTSAHQPLGPTRAASSSRNTPSRPTEIRAPKSSVSGGKKRKNAKTTTTAPRNSLGTIDPNSDPSKRRDTTIPPPPPSHTHLKRSPVPSSDNFESFPTDIPAGLYAKPESLTREQAQRLLASPAFLSMLEKMTGAPIDAATAAKRAREGEEDPSESSSGPSSKRSKLSHVHGHSRKGSTDSAGEPAHNAFVCWNCGRTKSAVWRTKLMEDGKSVRVCNACGLYWNKMGSMRPPTLWGDVDDDPKDRPRKDKKGSSGPSATRQSSQAPSSEPDIPAVRIDKPATRSSHDNGFKRTLSSVVEEDAKRIAALHPHAHLRKPPMPKSNLHHTSKPVPMSSPPRGSTSATKSLTNSKWNDQVAASSPIRWNDHQRNFDATQKSDNFHTDPVDPPTSSSRNNNSVGPLGSNQKNNKQTLDMPLSDDSPQPTEQRSNSNQQINWGTDLSAFFDVGGFSMPPAHTNSFMGDRTHGISPDAGPPSEFQKALSAEAGKLRKQKQTRSSSSSTSIGNTGHVGTDQSTEEDDVLSQLFNRTSSVGMDESSPPHPFDFSALPPSSPPISIIGSSTSELPHSALLLSSPDNSPLNDNFSPMENIKINTPGKSNLRHSFSANSFNHNNGNGDDKENKPVMADNSETMELGFEDIQRMLNNIGTNHNNNNQDGKSKIASPHDHQQGFDMLHEIFGKIDQNQLNHFQHQQHEATSSVGQADELMGGLSQHSHGGAGGNADDIFAMLEGGAFA